jgi:hypothetical protein
VIANPIQDVTSLMNPLDEAEWHREGLFNQVDFAEVFYAFPSRLTYTSPPFIGTDAHLFPTTLGSLLKCFPLPTFASSDGPPVSTSRLHLSHSTLSDLHHRSGDKVEASTDKPRNSQLNLNQ